MLKDFNSSPLGRKLRRTEWFRVARDFAKHILQQNIPDKFVLLDDRNLLEIASRVIDF